MLPIKYGRGHPVERHPVTDIMDPTNVTKVAETDELPDLPPAAFFGKAGIAGEGSSQQYGVLHDVPYQHDRRCAGSAPECKPGATR